MSMLRSSVLTLILLFAAQRQLMAQPALASGSITCVPGDQFNVSTCGPMPSGQAGPGQTWDFSGLTCTSTSLEEWSSPSGGQGFSSATVTWYAYGHTDFYEALPNAFIYLGYFDGITLSSLEYADPVDEIRYPFGMGSSYTDTFSGMRHFPDAMAQPDSELVTGTLLVEADAYGDLILPWGTVTNVLRLHKVRNTTDQNGITTLEQYLFCQPGEHEPWLTLNSWSYSWNTNAYQNAQYRPQTNNAIEDKSGQSAFKLYPNPANDRLMIRCDLEAPEMCTIDLIDLAGRKVLSTGRMNFAVGSTMQLDVSAIAPGTYRLRIVASEKQWLVPFVKQ